MQNNYSILVGIIILSILIIIFKKKIKKVWFKIPLLFEAGIETHIGSTPIIEKPVIKKSYQSSDYRELNEIETGKVIKDLPPNIYGFAHASFIDSELREHWGHLELTNLQKTNWYFEIRKSLNEIYLIGYISQDALARIGKSKIIGITIFAQPWNEFNNKVSISFSKILKSSARTIDTKNGNIRILDIETEEIIVL